MTRRRPVACRPLWGIRSPGLAWLSSLVPPGRADSHPAWPWGELRPLQASVSFFARPEGGGVKPSRAPPPAGASQPVVLGPGVRGAFWASPARRGGVCRLAAGGVFWLLLSSDVAQGSSWSLTPAFCPSRPTRPISHPTPFPLRVLLAVPHPFTPALSSWVSGACLCPSPPAQGLAWPGGPALTPLSPLPGRAD